MDGLYLGRQLTAQTPDGMQQDMGIHAAAVGNQQTFAGGKCRYSFEQKFPAKRQYGPYPARLPYCIKR